jgi:hypothetical protein
MRSEFRTRAEIALLFKETSTSNLKDLYGFNKNKSKKLFFDAVFVPHNYNGLEDWLPIINVIRKN